MINSRDSEIHLMSEHKTVDYNKHVKEDVEYCRSGVIFYMIDTRKP